MAHNRLGNAITYDSVRVADLDHSAGKQSRHAQRGGFVVGQAVEFDGRHLRCRHVRSHHRIEPLHQQRGASNATGLDESTAIHESIPRSRVGSISDRCEKSRSDYDSAIFFTTTAGLTSPEW